MYNPVIPCLGIDPKEYMLQEGADRWFDVRASDMCGF
jgi:hypothetical protein